MTKRFVSEDDLFEIQSVTDPQISPDGTQCLFVKTHLNEDENSYIANLYMAHLDTGEVRQWTFGDDVVTQPKWSKDGEKIAFLSNRQEKKQLYVMHRAGGEAEQVTDIENGVSSFEWAPCSTAIWITAAVKDGFLLGDKVPEEEEEVAPQPIRITKMKYKADSIGLLQQRTYRQIGLLHLTTKEITQVTSGNYDHTLKGVATTKEQIVFSVNRTEEDDLLFDTPLYLMDVPTGKETLIIERGSFEKVVFSHDDAYIAALGHDRTFENATHTNVFIYDQQEQSLVNLTEHIDAPVGDIVVADIQQNAHSNGVVWTENNDLYFQLSTMGDVRLYYASLDGAIYPATGENEHVYGFDITKNGMTALITVSTNTNPGELYKHHIATGERMALTHFNEPYRKTVTLIEPEKIHYPSDEYVVHGWLMKPANYVEGHQYPLIVEVHGGPHTFYANTFFHEMQLLAAKGYGVLYVNPRGSHSYSQQFVNGVRGNYGGGDYRDIMNGVDYVLAENSWIDQDRLGITGGSYGGFMTNWVVGQTNRFKAAVTQRSISNWISFSGVSDIGYFFNEWQIGASLKDMDTLWKHSPLKYADQITTPLLILHGERDFRCPIEQAEQLFITLKSLGKTTEFVRFPEADHNLSRQGKPSLRIARLEEISGWFERYL